MGASLKLKTVRGPDALGSGFTSALRLCSKEEVHRARYVWVLCHIDWDYDEKPPIAWARNNSTLLTHNIANQKDIWDNGGSASNDVSPAQAPLLATDCRAQEALHMASSIEIVVVLAI